VRVDTAIYVSIAMLASIQPFIADGSVPRWLGVPVAVTLAGLTAWKAKRSPGLSSTPPEESGAD
jgi:hypothetical protein